MRQLLIVSPAFVPLSTPDMQRVRMSVPFFSEHGWQPTILTVDPADIEGPCEPRLADTLPAGLPVERVRPLPLAWTRRIGVGNAALRALAPLYRAGCRIIREKKIDLIYFSTSSFFAVPLGRFWRLRYGTPFVVDLQDPWVNDSEEALPPASCKGILARRLHRVMERWTLRAAAGLISVSPRYVDAAMRRHPVLRGRPSAVVPFGFAAEDFAIARRHVARNPFFSPAPGRRFGVYVGRGGEDMQTALRVLFRALARAREQNPERFRNLQMYFVGTDYAPRNRSRRSVEPLARECGVADCVTELPERVPLLEALRLLDDADFLLLPGSDDPAYSASKIYPYLMAGKPLIAVVRKAGVTDHLLGEAGVGNRIVFDEGGASERCLEPTVALWNDTLHGDNAPPSDHALARWTPRNLTRLQCDLFDRVVAAAGTNRGGNAAGNPMESPPPVSSSIAGEEGAEP